jgi:two-component sensor histidine kinase
MTEASASLRFIGRDARRVADKIRAFDWSATPLGPSGGWPQSLQTTLGLMLNSPYPMWLAWGEGLTYFYNDAFQPNLADKPEPLGKPFAEAAADALPTLAPIMERALRGEASYFEDFPVTLERYGFREKTWWTFSYAPVVGEAGQVDGVLCIGRETTREVMARATLSTERERLARLFQQTPSSVAVLSGPSHVYELVNETHRGLAPGRDFVGRPVRQVFPEVEGQGVFERLDEVYASGRAHVETGFKVELAGPGGVPEEHFVDLVYQPLTDDDGAVSGIFVQGHDVTQRVTAEAAVREREERLRFALDAGRMGAWDLDVNAGEVTLSDGAREILGLPSGTPLSIADLEANSSPGAYDGMKAALREALKNNDPFFEAEHQHVRADDGQVRWILIRGRSRLVSVGGTLRCFGVLMDLTDRKEAEDRLRLLAREVDHRANNLLAAVQSVVNLTQAEDVPGFRERIRGRLRALANAHRLLAENRWTGAGLAQVVGEELEPYGGGHVRFEGPDAQLAPSVAQALAVALHELATNAAKHGSLSTPQGWTVVTWSGPDQERVVHMTWLEEGGPSPSSPARPGFGMTLLARAFAGHRGGSVELDWRPEGLCCRLTFPVL